MIDKINNNELMNYVPCACCAQSACAQGLEAERCSYPSEEGKTQEAKKEKDKKGN
jgi:hypothetical protein